MRSYLLFVALALCGAMSGCATVDGSFAKAFGETDTISRSNGGDVSLFTAAAEEVLRTGRRVTIDGQCDSACTVFADLARPNVCITPRAVFGYHRATTVRTFSRVSMQNWMRTTSSTTVEFREDPPASRDIATWVAARGGFPSEDLLLMNAGEASVFWPMCK